MGASIAFIPTKPHNSYTIKTGTPSALMQAMERAFGMWPVDLNESAIPRLEGMSAMLEDDDNEYDQIINAIKMYGAIRLFSEY